MAGDLKLKAGSQTGATILSTELNSLANAQGSTISAAVNQDTNLDVAAIFELNVDFVSAPTANSTVDIYLVPAVGGTNYADYTGGASTVANTNHYVGCFVLAATTSAQRVTSKMVLLPGCDFKIAVVNNSGQAFPASGSTVLITTWIYQYT